jgi:hypothetical protein
MAFHFLILCGVLACMACSAIIGIWWLLAVLFSTNDQPSMAVDLRANDPDPGIRIKATCRREGYNIGITDEQEHGGA